MIRPDRSATVHTEVIGNEVCLYDWRCQQVHALNPTAARVWQLCNGETTEAEMVAQLATEWGTDQAATLVRLALAEFDEKQLLRGGAAPPLAARLSRRQAMKRLGLAAAALPVVTSILAPRAVDAASVSGSQTFNYTGAQQAFIVPTGVTTLTITAYGAQGGTGNSVTNSGGLGGSVTAPVTVTAGETLYVYVGGAGQDGNSDVPAVGGFNGGGNGGSSGPPNMAGGGGGASDVRQGGAALSNRIVVAGGGGAAGSSGAAGGAGGGSTGANGSATAGGSGGTQTGGGTGGTISGGTAGTSGSPGTGGAGASGTNSNGGGGGGGYYGGGGGGAYFSTTDVSGGGGGGSSHPASGAGVTNTQGGHAGNGQVVISW